MLQKTTHPKSEAVTTQSRAKTPVYQHAPSLPHAPVETRGRDRSNTHYGHDLSDVRVYPDTRVPARMRSVGNVLSEDLSQPGDESEREAERVSNEITDGNTELPEISARPAPIQRMFANTEMMGTEMGFPDVLLPPGPGSAPGGSGRLPGNLDLMLPPGPGSASGAGSPGAGFPDVLLSSGPGPASGGSIPSPSNLDFMLPPGSGPASGAASAASGATDWLGDKASEAIGGVAGAAQSGLGWLGNTASEALSGGISPSWLMGKAGEAMGGLSGAASSAMNWFGGAENQAASGIANAGGQAANGIAGAAGQAASPILSFLQDHPESVLM